MVNRTEMWRRHANPWSVWTRFAAIPAFCLAVWSRVELGWFALVPVALVVLWLVVNPFAFKPIETPQAWVSRGIFGEQLWLKKALALSAEARLILRLLIGVGLAGFALMAWGLWALEVWPVLFGMTLTTLAQLWRIDRFAQAWAVSGEAKQ